MGAGCAAWAGCATGTWACCVGASAGAAWVAASAVWGHLSAALQVALVVVVLWFIFRAPLFSGYTYRPHDQPTFASLQGAGGTSTKRRSKKVD